MCYCLSFGCFWGVEFAWGCLVGGFNVVALVVDWLAASG